jgi:DNA-binding FadR family transcriptional regulator
MEAIVVSRRLHEQVVAVLLRSIVAGEVAPGSVLPSEPEMSTRFGVSRSVIREALRVLGEKGLVEVRHGSGTRVTAPERWDALDPAVLKLLHGRGSSAAVLRDLLEARKNVECELAGLAAERADVADRADIGAAIATMRAALDDPATYVRGDSAFHRTLVRAARNRVLERMSQPMQELVSYAQALTDTIPGVLARALAEHEAIAAAIERHDAEGARREMRIHLTHTERDVIALTEAST